MTQQLSDPSKLHPTHRRHTRPVLISAIIAVLANVLIWVTATAAGVNFVVDLPPSTSIRIGIALVAAVTMIAVLLGGIALAITARRWNRAPVFLGRLGLAIGVLTTTMPLTAAAEPGTKVALVSMHLLTGSTWWLVLHHAATERR